jgi:hypothetical protein
MMVTGPESLMCISISVIFKMKMRFFWDIAPYSLVGVDGRLRGVYFLHHHGDDDGGPDDGGSTHL